MNKRSYQVGFSPDEHDTIQQAVKLYREHNPQSRAVHGWTEYGSTGAVRRYTCIFCRAEIDTESKEYPPTRHATEATREHVPACALAYLTSEIQRSRAEAEINTFDRIVRTLPTAIRESITQNRCVEINAPRSLWSQIESELSIEAGAEWSVEVEGYRDIWGCDDSGSWRIHLVDRG